MSDRTKPCPSPDCDLEFPVDELAAHIADSHPGEYQRDDWPDTPAGHEGRVRDLVDDEDESEE